MLERDIDRESRADLWQLANYVFLAGGLVGIYNLGGYWGLAAGAVLLPLMIWVAPHSYRSFSGDASKSPAQPGREKLLEQVQYALEDDPNAIPNTAVFVVQLPLGQSNEYYDTATEKVKSAFRDDDICISLSYDRIGIFATSIRKFDPESGQQIAKRLQKATRKAVGQFDAKCYVGYCLTSHSPAQQSQALIDAAERALDEALACNASGICAYSKALGWLTVDSELVPQVRSALKDGSIRPAFQPQFDIRTKSLIGVEALARWHHPTKGMVSPVEFLAVIKAADAWADFTDTMLNSALQQLDSWDRQGIHVPTVGVNLSETDLSHPQIVERVHRSIQANNLTPDRLTVEILETVAAGADPAIVDAVQKLSDLGCSIDLDDFGTGHAAISALRHFPAERMKIDRSFVMNIDQDPQQQTMLETIVLMADRMGLSILVEGVETDAEIETLRGIGCYEMQGYGLGRPMDVTGFETWYRNDHAPKAVAQAPKVA